MTSSSVTVKVTELERVKGYLVGGILVVSFAAWPAVQSSGLPVDKRRQAVRCTLKPMTPRWDCWIMSPISEGTGQVSFIPPMDISWRDCVGSRRKIVETQFYHKSRRRDKAL